MKRNPGMETHVAWYMVTGAHLLLDIVSDLKWRYILLLVLRNLTGHCMLIAKCTLHRDPVSCCRRLEGGRGAVPDLAVILTGCRCTRAKINRKGLDPWCQRPRMPWWSVECSSPKQGLSRMEVTGELGVRFCVLLFRSLQYVRKFLAMLHFIKLFSSFSCDLE